MKTSKEKKDVQQQIFDEIRKGLPSRFDLARTISKLLDVSTDSVYRRVRGEKDLSLNELVILCKRFNISFDHYLNEDTLGTAFYYPPLRLSNLENYMTYSQGLVKFLKSIINITERELTIISSDIPMLHFSRFKELALFKGFESANRVFDCEDFNTYMKEVNAFILSSILAELSRIYFTLPTTEIWSENSLDSTLYKLRLYYRAGCFESKEMPLLICRQLLMLIDNLYGWAKTGVKSNNGTSSPMILYGTQQSYETDVIMLRSGPVRMTTLKLSAFNSIASSDPIFCGESENFIVDQIQQGLPLNHETLKHRYDGFFKVLEDKVYDTIRRIEEDKVRS